MGTVALEVMKKEANEHTLYIYENGYTKQKLPHWATHVSAPQLEQATGEGSSGMQETSGRKTRQRTIGGYFQVCCALAIFPTLFVKKKKN